MSPKIAELVAWARAHYDYVVIDSAPVGAVSDSFSFAKLADATLYVCRVDYTLSSDLRYANSIHTDGRLPNMVLVVNGVDNKTGYGYGYGYDHDVKKKRFGIF